MRTLSILLSVSLLACRSDDKATTDTADIGDVPVDSDGDGYDSDEDCDDNNSLVSPGAEETCDGADNNCDGQIDEGVLSTSYADSDGDGFGDPDASVESCEAPSGYVSVPNDCDDDSADSYPGAAERCDGLDNDCDGSVDEDIQDVWYADADADGYGDADTTTESCDPPSGYVADATDCDDLDSDAYPDAPEVCDEVDNDCDDAIDEDVTTTYYKDTDADSYGLADDTTEACSQPTGYAARAGDCDDSSEDISPNATELCNGVDDDCDGDIDEDDAADATTFYADDDADGYGDATDSTEACAAPTGYVDSATDCDDTTALANPGESEVCDSIDNDCDGETDEDEATDATTWYADSDGDGYGSSSSTVACSQPTGFADNSDDCDDGEALANPGESEVCDDIDNDCDGTTDEGLTSTYYADADSDGYGNASFSTEACAAPAGYVSDDTDCDDGEEDANPGGAEVCDSIDNDCDGSVDEGATSTYYLDYDSDGYGDVDRSTEGCSAPSGYVSDATDCDDTSADANPGESEVCDEADNDCDGETDEGVTSTFYEDDDGDGYGDVDAVVEACEAGDAVADATDCDDTDEDINPGADEACDSTDHDCDGDALSDDCGDCEAIMDAGLDDGDGVYTIDIDGEGGQDPFDAYCDMTTDGGGWTLWWWYESGAGMSGVTDVLDGDVWDCDPSSDASCLSKLPVSDPDELMVLNQVGSWAVWEFDGTTTSDNVLDAFVYQTSVTECSNAWTPVAQDGTMSDDPYVCDENNNADPGCDCFWYRSQNSVYSFYLDDDTGWAETAFGAGYDSSNTLGVDSLETSYRYHSTSYDLWMYWR